MKNEMNCDFDIGGGWGCHVSWLNPEEFNADLTESSVYSVYGHLPNRPSVGQTLLGDFKKSKIKFEFISVELMSNPNDMFFAKVKPIAQFLKD